MRERDKVVKRMRSNHSWQRPKLKIPRTTSEWVFDIIGYTAFIGSIIFLIVIWSSLPEQVPGHFNAAGEADRWGSKWELVILPFVSLFSLILLQAFELFPEMHNYPKRLNDSNAPQFYLVSRQLLNQVKNITLLMFAVLQIQSISIALEWGESLGKWFLPVVIISVFVPIIICMIRFRKIK